MGFTEPALFHDDLTALRVALPTIDIDALRADGFVGVPYPADRRPYADGGFATASGKAELRCDALAASGQPVLPTYLPPDEAPSGQFPFALLTPKQHTRFLNSSYSHLPKHGPLEGSPYVEISVVDAAELEVVEGDCVKVWNHRGALELPARISERVRPGVVAVPWGWWAQHHPNGHAANTLTSDTLTEWGGGVAFWDTAVAIEPMR
jgi:anaerobic selenocysteine-containing dehydrogenase